MHYLEKYVITYNGEVYNYLEIKEELKKDGYLFSSNSDTEVILASYDKWGEECVNKFNGMWAFAIYDKEKEIIFCSRDRFGVKPFYYTEIDDKFIFASEIKQLLEFYEDKFVNKKILMDYLIIGYEDHTNETFFQNIFKLQPSHNLVYDLKLNSYKIKRYYDILPVKMNLDENSSIDEYRSKLVNSIKLRLRSDVKIGTCLSGGLDSSSIAAIASDIYKSQNNDKFVAIHAKSSEKSSDESFFAQEVSKANNLDLNIIEPSKEDFINSIDDVIYTQEEPFGGPSIFMQYFVMKKAKEIGCTVLLDGQGGDETLLGYERYYPAYLMSLSFFEFLKGFISVSRNSKLTIMQLITYYVYFTRARIRIKRLKNKNSFVKKEYLELTSFDILEKNAKNYLNIFALQHEEIFYTQMPHLLRYEDKNSMKHSIETRLPFIDYRLVETALAINNKYKIKDGWTKYLLRKSIDKILPKSVVWRKNKFGFEAPSKSWLNSIEKEMIDAIENSKMLNIILDSFDYKKLNDIQKWKLFNIAKWEEIYKIKWS